jgi:zinc-finger of transposase IS204/IS1001/IS1096/IS1165
MDLATDVMIIREPRALWFRTGPPLFGVAGLQVVEADTEPDGSVTVWVATDDPGAAACPDCGTVSGRVHEHLLTRPRDLRRGQDEVSVCWLKRRWKCAGQECRPYWYLREMGWVDGKAKKVSERYVGTAAELEALLDAREERMLPERTRHLDFGAVAAAWGLLADLGVAAVIDEATGPGPPGLPLSPGTYLALAVLNRMVDPCSKRGFADWWRTTAADRFTKIGPRRWITAGSGMRCTRCPWRAWSGSRRSWRWRRAHGSSWTPARWPWT